MATTTNNRNQNLVLGKVTDANKRPLAKLKVEIYDADMREWQPLGDTFTDDQGQFKISWLHSQLSGRGKGEADIAVKIFTKEKGVEVFKSSIDEVRFNASKREEINITVKEIISSETVEFDTLLKDILLLANKVAITDLQENNEYHDVTFLSKEIGVSTEKIEYMVVSHRLQRASDIEPAFFYALFRKNTLLVNNFNENMSSRSSVGLNSDDETLLYDAALTDPKIIERDIKAAVNERIVGQAEAKNLKQNIEKLSRVRGDAEEYYKNAHQEKVVSLLYSFFKKNKIQEINSLFKENKNDLNGFLNIISASSFYRSEKGEKEAKTTIEIGKLFGFGDSIIPNVAKAIGVKRPEDVKNLASLNKAEWVDSITKTRPDIKDKNLINTYASAMVRKMENTFPTQAFSAQLKRSKNKVLKNQDKVVSFFSKHKDFDLVKSNIDLFLKEKKVKQKDNDAVNEELKSVQRIFRLVPNYSKTIALRNENIKSSQNIVALGEKRFVDEVAPKAGIETTEAKQIFRKAESKHTGALLLLGDLQDSMSVMDIASFETAAMSKKLEAVSKDFPNLKSLFKLTDVCECEHCRSVYSPAAYLVEILQFIEKRNVVANNAKSILFNRRPELGEIDLGCANANTPVKYIDLVCEILEEAVAPDSHFIYSGKLSDGPDSKNGIVSADLANDIRNAQIKLTNPNDGTTSLIPANYKITDKASVMETGITESGKAVYYLRDEGSVYKLVNSGVNQYKVYRLKQTFGTAEELDAAPEYVNPSAYYELQNRSFAFNLPFDLYHTEAKAYLKRFDVERADLMKVFQVGSNPADESVAAESLGLTNTELNIIVTPQTANNRQQLYWNVPAPGNVINYLKNVEHFLDKTELSYNQLDTLLKLKFINKDDNLFVKHNYDDPVPGEDPVISCDTAKKEIANLDLPAIDRIHRFLRLQKKTGWKYEFLDEVISQVNLGNKNLDNTCLIKAAQLKEIAQKTGIKLDELSGFFGSFPYELFKEGLPKPLYHQIFLNKAKNGIINEDFLPEKVDGSLSLSGYYGYLATCLGLKQKEVELLAPLTGASLDFVNLSYFFAVSRLTKKLKLKVDELVLLIQLSGINFTQTPEQLLAFINSVESFKKTPVKAADVSFYLNHEAPNLADREIKTEKIDELLAKLKADYDKLKTDLKSKYEPLTNASEQKETLQAELSKLVGITPEDTKIAVQFTDANWDFKWIDDSGTENIGTTVAHADTFLTYKFDKLLDLTAVNVALTPIKTAKDNVQTAAVAQDAALLGIISASVAVENAANPADVATAQAQLSAAIAQEVITNAALVAANSALGNAQKVYVEALFNAISAYQFANAVEEALLVNIAAAFKTPVETVKVVLKHASVKLPAPGLGTVFSILTNDINVANYVSQSSAIKLLHKLLPLINMLKVNNTDLEWYMKNNANSNLGWFELDKIPYQPTLPKADFNKFLDFVQFISFAQLFTPVDNPVDPENPVTFFTVANMILESNVTRDEFISILSVLTGYEKLILEEIDLHLFGVFSVENYNKASNWSRALNCAELLVNLGVGLDQVKKYIKHTLLPEDANTLRTALKSKYDEDAWLSTLKEIMDAVRPQKRDALIAYMLAVNPEIKDTNDLYDYFLVDVEMGSCMPSSRIVLAHNSIQLFVQRCLMGLEPEVIANVEADPNWNQWKWMKNYRVWEANRKVFLYPENWYDVSLTSDPSFLLSEFVDEIQQNELTNDTAEEALRRYLEKLDSIAFLEVMATWYDVPERDMHVFARTKGGDPCIYYYRRFEKERYWTPWEKVELEISGDHLLAFKRNNRLHLAWPVFTEVADENQGATLPNQSDTGEQPIDKPRKQLKIQLAISELANKKWQPKKISKESILTPETPTKYLIDKDQFNMIYLEVTDQIWFYTYDHESNNIRGIFDIAGCKGYPELAFEGNAYFPDLYPDFENTDLKRQRYIETGYNEENNLAVRHAMYPQDYRIILNETPGKFRITYPHQFTDLDLVGLIFMLLQSVVQSSTQTNNIAGRGKGFKIPMGTLLPYFMEDSRHAYVVTPGFYKVETDKLTGRLEFTDSEKKTASDVFDLMDAISNWYKKTEAEFAAHPEMDDEAKVQYIITDPAFQHILEELAKYMNLDVMLNFMIGKTGNDKFDEFLKKTAEASTLKYGEQFKNMYHPLVCTLRSTLYKEGIPALMKRDTQLQVNENFDFKTHYLPHFAVVPKTSIKQADGTTVLSYPIEDVDFNEEGSYSSYNWDLFFRVPLHIASSLTKNQRFEEALTWFHYMFNPTGALSGDGVQKYWVTKPFYLNQDIDYVSQRIDKLLYGIKNVTDDNAGEIGKLEKAIDEWRTKPFMPDVVARSRPVAYQKALLMKYLDNLTEWGDYLFRQDTMESVAQATQMYILADKLLGPKPRIIPTPVKPPYQTYNQINAQVDSFGNALVELENILPDLSALPEGGDELPPPPITLSMMYFCIPPNEKMGEYWDRVADRLFKIRNCQNIDGVERSLALFAPPIDPGMLVRAAASGLDISAVIAGVNAPAPFYRFQVLSQKAGELAQEVRGLGNALLQALEKKDAEAISLLRNELELKMLNAVTQMKKLQVNESKEQIEVLKRTQKVTEERRDHYASIEKITSKEQLNLDKLKEANEYQFESQIVRTVAGALSLIPEFHIGASGFGGSPSVVMQLGGSAISKATNIGADILNILSTMASYEANRASILAGYDRRFEDWKHQERLANKELASIEKQIAAAQIRKEIAETDLKNHQLQIDNSKKTDEFMRTKFTNKELYDWSIGQISTVYFKSYKLAYDFAKKAERSYRFELGNDDYFISYGYWDSMKKGLQSADNLIHDLKIMETSYLDKNKREYEITKHISLAQLDSLSLIKLRAAGSCDFEIPEALYDMDFAGQYFRRIKSVSISIPCIAGPYTSVSAKLSLVNNRYRKNTNPDNSNGDGYTEMPGNDERFIYNVGAIQSIAASSSQNDSGVFELNFKDERYLPFEGTGAVSSWRLELPSEVRQFNYDTIADAIIHIRYTAREGGSVLKNAADTALIERLTTIKQGLGQSGLHLALNLRHDFANEWHLLKKNATVDLTIAKNRLSYIAQSLNAGISEVMFIAKVNGNPANFKVKLNDTENSTPRELNLARVSDIKLATGKDGNIVIDEAFNLSASAANIAKLEDMILVVKFDFEQE